MLWVQLPSIFLLGSISVAFSVAFFFSWKPAITDFEFVSSHQQGFIPCLAHHPVIYMYMNMYVHVYVYACKFILYIHNYLYIVHQGLTLVVPDGTGLMHSCEEHSSAWDGGWCAETCTHTFVPKCMSIYMNIYMYIYTCTCTCTCAIHIFSCICTCIRMYTSLDRTSVYTCMFVFILFRCIVYWVWVSFLLFLYD